jgi:outer membrane protein OmpA-like peptidoglycan-associated protein
MPVGESAVTAQAISAVVEGAWTSVAAPEEQQPAASTEFAPVAVTAPPPQAANSSQSQGWNTVAPASTSQPGYTQVPLSNGAPTASSNPQWSQPAASAPFNTAPPRRRSIWPKLIGAALVLILLIGAAVIGGVIYVGYKVRQKTRAVREDLAHMASDKSLSDLTKGGAPDAKGALQGLFGALTARAGADGLPVLSHTDPTTPCSASPFPAQDKARVPFKPGTVITTAWGIKYGDVEAMNSIDSIDGSTVATTNRTGEYKNDNGAMAKALTITNQNCNSDYLSARSYMTVNAQQLPMLMHDLTRFRLSDKTFQEIKSSSEANFTYEDIWYVPNGVKLTRQGGVLTRVEPQDVNYPMIVNDQRVDLPAIHLKGMLTIPEKDPRPASQRPKQSEGELFVLDDVADPLVLNWKLKDPLFHNGNFRVEVVKINFPVAKPVNVVEKQLIEQKRAVTYGIYFDFNKDTLKPESEPVLKEIAETMAHNPDWKLTVEGHTDNVGGDAYNLDLSKRRAAAVKQALVSQYNIAPERLLTGGYGASRPVAPNDTLEGRARNRRVELVRE